MSQSQSGSKNTFKIKNSAKLISQVKESSKQIIESFENKSKIGQKKFNEVFERNMNKIKKHIELKDDKYNKANKNSLMRKLKYIPYMFLTLSIVAVTNILLISKFVSAVKDYNRSNSGITIGQKNYTQKMNEFFSLFGERLKTLSTIQKLLAGTLLLNTFVNLIPDMIKNADKRVGKPFLPVLIDTLKNSLMLERL